MADEFQHAVEDVEHRTEVLCDNVEKPPGAGPSMFFTTFQMIRLTAHLTLSLSKLLVLVAKKVVKDADT